MNLLVTVPSLNHKSIAKIEHIVSNPFVSGIRWNTGISSSFEPNDVLKILKAMTLKYGKTLWVDLKGRQLRVSEWGMPMYSCIKTNHSFTTSLPAKILLRGEKPLDVVEVKGNCVYVDPLPRHAVGAGQSLNILSDNLKVNGYLTELDKIYLTLCQKMNICNIMASFVEEFSDIEEILKIFPECNLVSKIESQKGIDIIPYLKGGHFMAARDDLYIQMQNHAKMISALKEIIVADPDAICASRIFTSLENSETVSFSDFEDLIMMNKMGYQNFMLCDNISNYHFDEAIIAWEEFVNANK